MFSKQRNRLNDIACDLIYNTQDLSCGTVLRLITCEENSAANPMAALIDSKLRVAKRQTNNGSTI